MKMKVRNGISITMGVIMIWFFSIILAEFAVMFRILLYIAALLLVVRITPICRKRETHWLFLLNIPAGIPLNICLVYQLIKIGLFQTGVPVIGDIVQWSLLYLCFLSIEQIAIGVIGRAIWKEQNPENWEV